MPSERSLENLKNGHKFKRDDEATKAAARAAGKKRSQNVALRKQLTQMLQSPQDVDASTLTALRRFGIDDEHPGYQAMMLVRLLGLTGSVNGQVALKAIAQVVELTGSDAATQLAKERMKLDKERIAIDRERLELERLRAAVAPAPDAVPCIIDDISGDDGEAGVEDREGVQQQEESEKGAETLHE